jgi:hypothetical protein
LVEKVRRLQDRRQHLLDAVLKACGVDAEKLRVARDLRRAQRAPIRAGTDSLNELECTGGVPDDGTIAARQKLDILHGRGREPPRSIQILLDDQTIDLGRRVVVKNADFLVGGQIVGGADGEPEDVTNGALVLLTIQAT